jgi:hypothetical protein
MVKRNDNKSASSFCHQVAAWVPNIFTTLIWQKMAKLLITQQPLKLEKKSKHRFGILRNLDIFDAHLKKLM